MVALQSPYQFLKPYVSGADFDIIDELTLSGTAARRRSSVYWTDGGAVEHYSTLDLRADDGSNVDARLVLETTGAMSINSGALSISPTEQVQFNGVKDVIITSGAGGYELKVDSTDGTLGLLGNVVRVEGRTGGVRLIGPVLLDPSTAAAATFTIPPGVAPTTPADGDIWTTGVSIFAQIGGATKDLAGGGGGPESDGDLNTAYGTNAIPAHTPGVGQANTALGADALVAVATGLYNIGIGYSPLQGVTSGVQNIGIGGLAGRNIVDGNSNIAIGQDSLPQAVSTNDAIAIGYNAVGSQSVVPTGDRNIGIGRDALHSIAGGVDNIAIGFSAAGNAVGNAANATTTASQQVAIGTRSGAISAATGDEGTAVGSFAGYNTRGTALGATAQAQGADSTAVGYGAVATLANQIEVGRATEFVRIPGLLRLPHRAAPAGPVDGDIWTTAAGMFVRIGGVTRSINLT